MSSVGLLNSRDLILGYYRRYGLYVGDYPNLENRISVEHIYQRGDETCLDMHL